MQSNTTDLVADTKFRVEFHSDFVHRFTFQSSNAPGQYMRRKERLDVWKKEKSVGCGSYGSVWLHRCLTSEDQAELQAVKILGKRLLSAAHIDFYKELETIAKFSQKKYHGLFVEYLGWYENDDSVFIVMEYLQHGDLDSCLTAPMPENEAREITFQIAEGLEHLHENHFVHRDLKPANVFVVRPGPQWWVKIGDFGFSKRIKEDSCLRSMVGTRMFLAPEVQMIYPPGIDETSATLNYSEKVDIWSLGVMTFYMHLQIFPFTSNGQHELRKYVRGGPFPFPDSPLAHTLSKECCDFMVAAMAPDSTMRLSARGVLESDWLKHRTLDLVSGMNKLQMTTKLSSADSPQDKESIDSQGTIVPRIYEKPLTTINSSELKSWTTSLTPTNFQEESLRPASRNSGSPKADGLETSRSYYEQGMAFFFTGQYKLAEGMLKQAFEAGKRVLGPNHPNSLDCLLSIGEALYYGTEHAEAEAVFRQVFTGREQIFGSTHKDTLKALHWLGEALFHQGKYAEAETTFQLASDGRKQAFTPTHERTLNSLHWLGLACMREAKHAKAERIYRQAYEGRKQVLGPNHEDTLHTLHLLGVAIYRQGKYAEAEAVSRKASKGREKALGPTHEKTLNSLHWQGLTLLRQQKYTKAVAVFERAFEGRRGSVGENHADTLVSLRMLKQARRAMRFD